MLEARFFRYWYHLRVRRLGDWRSMKFFIVVGLLHDIVRTGNGHIVRENYVINPPFRPVLRDVFFERQEEALA
jgi:hypothetical protein